MLAFPPDVQSAITCLTTSFMLWVSAATEPQSTRILFEPESAGMVTRKQSPKPTLYILILILPLVTVTPFPGGTGGAGFFGAAFFLGRACLGAVAFFLVGAVFFFVAMDPQISPNPEAQPRCSAARLPRARMRFFSSASVKFAILGSAPSDLARYSACRATRSLASFCCSRLKCRDGSGFAIT